MTVTGVDVDIYIDNRYAVDNGYGSLVLNYFILKIKPPAICSVIRWKMSSIAKHLGVRKKNIG